MKNTKVIFDIDTGEILRTINDDERINIYSMNDVRQGFYKRQKGFFKLYRSSLSLFYCKQQKQVYINTLFRLLELLPYGSVLIQIGGFPASQRKIADNLHMSIRTLRNHLNKLTKFEILKKKKYGREFYYFVNPYFVYTGKNPSDESLEMFFNSKWNNAKKGGKSNEKW